MARKKAAPAKSGVRAYRVLAGRYSEGVDAEGNIKIYRPGKIVRSSRDLVKLFGKERFRALDVEIAEMDEDEEIPVVRNSLEPVGADEVD